MENTPKQFAREELREAIRQFYLLVKHIEIEKNIKLLRRRRKKRSRPPAGLVASIK